jgi:hypothetical protein
MAADACCYAYGLLMAIDDEHRKSYLNYVLNGKPLRNLKTGLTFIDENGKEKHQKYTTNFLAQQISQNLMPDFMEIYDLSSGYIHPSGFYFHKEDINEVNFEKYENSEIEYMKDANIHYVQYSKDAAIKFHNLMHELNQLFVHIMERIMGLYEHEYLKERYDQFPLRLHADITPLKLEDGTYARNEEGNVENLVTFHTSGKVIWDFLEKYESNPEAMLNQYRELVLGGLDIWEIVDVNVALNTIINKETSKEYLQGAEDLEDAYVEYQMTQTQIKQGKLLHTDFLFPGKKLKRKTNKETTKPNPFEGL